MAGIRRKTSDRNGGSGGILEKIKALKKEKESEPQLFQSALSEGTDCGICVFPYF